MLKVKRIVCYWKSKTVVTRIIQYDNNEFAFQYKRGNKRWRNATVKDKTLKSCTKAMLAWRSIAKKNIQL